MLLALLLAQAAPSCPATPPALPAALAGWRSPRSEPGIGHVFPVSGAEASAVPALGGTAIARGGLAAAVPIEITRRGTYRVALSERAWVEVTANNRPLPSAAHGHGPACSGIAKMVDFALEPGRYTLQLSAMKAASLRVLIARV